MVLRLFKPHGLQLEGEGAIATPLFSLPGIGGEWASGQVGSGGSRGSRGVGSGQVGSRGAGEAGGAGEVGEVGEELY